MPESRHIAFVCPRFPEGATVGGAETLLKQLALRLSGSGMRVSFLTTCASNHFTWENELPAGETESDGIRVLRFPVDEGRDLGTFLEVQDRISRGCEMTPDEEQQWLRNNVNSTQLCDYLKEHKDSFDRVIMGPYLFSLVLRASQTVPAKTVLVPCLHDEPFAYLSCFKEMFHSVHSIIFNTEPEKVLAEQLYSLDTSRTAVVGMGIEAPAPDAASIKEILPSGDPYLIYSGRREGLKGTPMLLDYINAFRKRTGKTVRLVLTGSGQIYPPPDLMPFITDLGFVSEQTKIDAMAGAAAFCHPSALESFGIVVMESWLAGTPCLVNTRSEVLKHHCRMSNGGLWFRNYPEFEEELKLLLDNDEARRQMGKNGREYVKEVYSWDSVEKRLLEAVRI